MQEANSNKFNSCSVTRLCRRRNGISAAGRSSKKRSTTDSEIRSATPRDNPVYHVFCTRTSFIIHNFGWQAKSESFWDHLSKMPNILSSGFPDNAAFLRTNPQVGSKLSSDQCIGLISPNCGSVLAAIRLKWWGTASRGLAEPLFSVGAIQKQSVVIPCAGLNVRKQAYLVGAPHVPKVASSERTKMSGK